MTGLQRPLTYGKRIEGSMTESLAKCIQHIWKQEGAAGFYKGLSPSLIKARPALRQHCVCRHVKLRYF